MENFYEEYIVFEKSLSYQLTFLDSPPIFSVVSQLEKFIQRHLRGLFEENLKTIALKNFNYQKIWNELSNKKIIFQMLYLITDILFYHDVTTILAIREDLSLQ